MNNMIPFNDIDFLKNVTVLIKSSRMEKSAMPSGSGVLYKKDKDVFVLTCAHCICKNKNESIETLNKNYKIQIQFKFNNIEEPKVYNDIEIHFFKYDEVYDICVLKIISSIDLSIPQYDFFPDSNDLRGHQLCFNGYPYAYSNNQQNPNYGNLEIKYVMNQGKVFVGNLINNDQNRSDDFATNVRGYSGSGIFIEKEKKCYLIGLFTGSESKGSRNNETCEDESNLFAFNDCRCIGISQIQEYFNFQNNEISNKQESNFNGTSNKILLTHFIEPINLFSQELLNEDWEIILTLHHLLPTTYLIQLCDFILKKSTNDELGFFEVYKTNREKIDNIDKVIIEPSGLDVRNNILPTIEALLNNDDDIPLIYIHLQENVFNQKIMRSLEIGRNDFQSFKRFKEIYPPNGDEHFSIFLRIIYEASEQKKEATWKFVKSTIKDFDPLIQMGVVKHISDLYVDSDDWDLAKQGYLLCKNILDESKLTSELAFIWEQFIDSSIGACIKVIDGKETANAYYSDIYKNKNLLNNRYFYLNSRYDYYNSKDIFNPDFKLLNIKEVNSITTNTNSYQSRGVFSWLNKEYRLSFRLFWADLRREIANGDLTNFSSTKYRYGIALLDSALNKPDKKLVFYQALNLIIESSHSEKIKIENWTKYQTVIEDCIDEIYFDEIFKKAERYTGSIYQRIDSVIKIFELWFPLITNKKIIIKIWEKTISLLRTFKFTDPKYKYLNDSLNKSLIQYIKTKPDMFTEDLQTKFYLLVENKNESILNGGRELFEFYNLIDAYILHFSDESRICNIIHKAIDIKNEADIHATRNLIYLIGKEKLKSIYQSNLELQKKVLDTIRYVCLENKEMSNYLLPMLFNINESEVVEFYIDKTNSKFIENLFNINIYSEIDYYKLLSLSLLVNALNRNEQEQFFKIIIDMLTIGDKERMSPFIYSANDSMSNVLHFFSKIGNEDKRIFLKEKINEIYKRIKIIWRKAKDSSVISSQIKIIFNQSESYNKATTFNFAVLTANYALALNRENDLLELIGEIEQREHKYGLIKATFREFIFDDKSGGDTYVNDLIKIIKSENLIEIETAISSILANLNNFSEKNKKKILEELRDKVFGSNPNMEHLPILTVLNTENVFVGSRLLRLYNSKLKSDYKLDMLLHPYIAALLRKNKELNVEEGEKNE